MNYWLAGELQQRDLRVFIFIILMSKADIVNNNFIPVYRWWITGAGNVMQQ